MCRSTGAKWRALRRMEVGLAVDVLPSISDRQRQLKHFPTRDLSSKPCAKLPHQRSFFRGRPAGSSGDCPHRVIAQILHESMTRLTFAGHHRVHLMLSIAPCCREALTRRRRRRCRLLAATSGAIATTRQAERARIFQPGSLRTFFCPSFPSPSSYNPSPIPIAPLPHSFTCCFHLPQQRHTHIHNAVLKIIKDCKYTRPATV